MVHKTYRYYSHTLLEDVCQVSRHNSYCKWAVGAAMVCPTPANNTPQLSSVPVVSCCIQTNCPCHVKSMGIVPMHEWKVPLKNWGMLPFPSGHGARMSGGHHGAGRGYLHMEGTKNLRRNWILSTKEFKGWSIHMLILFKMKTRRHHLVTYAAPRWLPPPLPQ